MSSPASWLPTPAFVRSVLVALVALGIGLLARRPDVVLVGVPFLGAASYGWARRPAGRPVARLAIDASTLFEGQATTARLHVEAADGDAGAMVTTVLATPEWLTTAPTGGGRTAPTATSATTEMAIPVRAIRWGRHELSAPHAVCTSVLGAFRTPSLSTLPLRVTCLPLADQFNAVDAVPRPAGLVGLHRSRRQGGGTELAEVRPFVAGDRLRRINWRVTSRTGDLHVNATWTDRDSEVVLLLDTEYDLGASAGIDGTASSLDTAMRAAASLAEHYLHTGDRVRVIDLGRRIADVPSAGGRAHLRRILDVLVAACVGTVRAASLHVDNRLLGRVEPGSLVIALTPLLGAAGVGHVANLVQRGHSVIVVDTMPDDAFAAETPWRALAIRCRLLERQVEIDRLGELGVPTVRWRGPGTLDDVLRDVARLAAAPRIGANAR